MSSLEQLDNALRLGLAGDDERTHMSNPDLDNPVLLARLRALWNKGKLRSADAVEAHVLPVLRAAKLLLAAHLRLPETEDEEELGLRQARRHAPVEAALALTLHAHACMQEVLLSLVARASIACKYLLRCTITAAQAEELVRWVREAAAASRSG